MSEIESGPQSTPSPIVENSISLVPKMPLSAENEKLLADSWALATLNGSAPYLARNDLGAFGTAATASGALYVPMRDASGELKNIQRLVAPDDTGKTNGPENTFLLKDQSIDGLHHIIGSIQPDTPIVLSADYADAAAIHQSTGLPVVVTFSDDNTPSVAQQFLAKALASNSKLVLHVKALDEAQAPDTRFTELEATPGVVLMIVEGEQKVEVGQKIEGEQQVEGVEDFTGKSLAELMQKFGGKVVKSLIDEALASSPELETSAIENIKSKDLQVGGDGEETLLKLKSQYLVAENKFYLRDNTKTLAFEDTGKAVTTVLESPEVIRSMLELSMAKGWREVKLNGSNTFKRRAWIEAQLLGIKTQRYTPDDFDKNELAQRQATALGDAAKNNSIEQVLAPAVTVSSDSLAEQTIAPDNELALRYGSRLAKELQKALARQGHSTDSDDTNDALDYVAGLAMSPRAFVGKLLDHGPAPYEFKELGTPNYFVNIETPFGVKTVWGVDIPRALSECQGSSIKRGDDILLAFQGSKPVTVVNELTGEKVLTHRNSWYADKVADLPAVARRTENKPTYTSPPSGVLTTSGKDAKEQMLAGVLMQKGAPPDAINKALTATANAPRPAAAPSPATSFKPTV
jgi:hypothetical protein